MTILIGSLYVGTEGRLITWKWDSQQPKPEALLFTWVFPFAVFLSLSLHVRASGTRVNPRLLKSRNNLESVQNILEVKEPAASLLFMLDIYLYSWLKYSALWTHKVHWIQKVPLKFLNKNRVVITVHDLQILSVPVIGLLLVYLAHHTPLIQIHNVHRLYIPAKPWIHSLTAVKPRLAGTPSKQVEQTGSWHRGKRQDSGWSWRPQDGHQGRWPGRVV